MYSITIQTFDEAMELYWREYPDVYGKLADALETATLLARLPLNYRVEVGKVYADGYGLMEAVWEDGNKVYERTN